MPAAEQQEQRRQRTRGLLHPSSATGDLLRITDPESARDPAVPWSLGGGAAIPSVVRVRRCRQTPERDGHHSPGVAPAVAAIPPTAVMANGRRGVRRAASSAHGQAGSGSRGTFAAADGHDDGSAGGRAGGGYRWGAAGLGLVRGGGAVFGPARIAALGLSGPSPSRDGAALVSRDCSAA
jgi:hypothetical protein